MPKFSVKGKILDCAHLIVFPLELDEQTALFFLESILIAEELSLPPPSCFFPHTQETLLFCPIRPRRKTHFPPIPDRLIRSSLGHRGQRGEVRPSPSFLSFLFLFFFRGAATTTDPKWREKRGRGGWKKISLYTALYSTLHTCAWHPWAVLFFFLFSLFFVLSPPFSCKKKWRSMFRKICFIIQNFVPKYMQNKEMQKGQNSILVFFPLDISQGEQAGWPRSGN